MWFFSFIKYKMVFHTENVVGSISQHFSNQHWMTMETKTKCGYKMWTCCLLLLAIVYAGGVCTGARVSTTVCFCFFLLCSRSIYWITYFVFVAFQSVVGFFFFFLQQPWQFERLYWLDEMNANILYERKPLIDLFFYYLFSFSLSIYVWIGNRQVDR